jgi:CheY-like chemotaxis protein
LGEAGATVETACSAAEGFAVFRRFRPDVLVSDIGMPVEDGLSFMARVRMLPTMDGGQTPSLALTAFASEDDRASAITAGYTAHISKPVTPSALTAMVASVVTR